jgi:hypothetical protein
MKEAGDELIVVLKKIEDDRLLTPLQIVRALSGTGVAHLGVVKNFLAETIERERRDIENVGFCLGITNVEPEINRRLQRGDRKEGKGDFGIKGKAYHLCIFSLIHDQCAGIPGYKMFGVWHASGPTNGSLHVQTFISSTVFILLN